MTELRQKALAFAVSHYLKIYPQGNSFNEICELVRQNEWSDELQLQEVYSDCAGEWVADEIEIMASLLEVTFG